MYALCMQIAIIVGMKHYLSATEYFPPLISLLYLLNNICCNEYPDNPLKRQIVY